MRYVRQDLGLPSGCGYGGPVPKEVRRLPRRAAHWHIVEVADIANIEETLATRGDHEQITNEVRDLMRQQGVEPYVLSTEACAVCDRCAYLDGEKCRFPDKMHPCIESQGINIIPVLESCGLEFQFGDNMVTWYSLLLFNE